MRNLLILFSILFFILCGVMVEAKPYKPITGEGNYAVDIPDDVVLPFDPKRLILESTQFFQLSDEIVIVVISYRDPNFMFVSKAGDQLNPYIEIFRWIIAKGVINFCSFSFINSRGLLDVYVDGESPFTSPGGKFKKVELEKFKNRIFKKVPVIKTIKFLEKKEICKTLVFEPLNPAFSKDSGAFLFLAN